MAACKLVAAAGTKETGSRGIEFRKGCLIKRRAFALSSDLTVPFKAEALQGAQDVVGGTWYNAWSIEIFDPEQPCSASGARL